LTAAGQPGADHALADAVERLVRGLPAESVVSVWLGDLDGRRVYARRERVTHYAASTMKLPLLVAAYRRHERGEIDLDAELPVHNAFRSAFDGSAFTMDQSEDQDDETWSRVGHTMSLRALARHATVRSGNLATNLLLEHVGTAEVAAVLTDAGCSPSTTLPRGIEDAAARRAGLDNLVTAADLARVLGGVGARRLAGADTCRAVEEVLAAQEHRDQVPAGLPDGTYVANKTGWVDGVAHDVALVRPDAAPPYVVAVCTTAPVSEETLYALNAAISTAIWERWTA
jgi:beta-lactamase class A